MNIQDEIYKIIGQRLLYEFDSNVMVKWAVNAIQMGYESESLIILAGMDYDSTEEREQYFWKSLEELKLNVKKEEPELINDYAKYVANAVLNQQLSPRSGLKKMNNICRSTGYDSKYIQFYEIEEDLDYLKHDLEYSPIYNQSITLDNADEFIIKEFKIFLECEALGIKRDLREKAFCNSCKQITKPELKTKLQIKRPFKYKEFVCQNCKSNKVDPFSSQIGKEKILKKIKATYNDS